MYSWRMFPATMKAMKSPSSTLKNCGEVVEQKTPSTWA
ncbi:hypothetical protein LINPERPRIM_LOCUS17109, partial [Linum perenne]